MKKPLQLTLTISLFIACCSSLTAQSLQYVLGDILLQPKPGVDMPAFTQSMQEYRGVPTQLTLVRQVSAPMNVWKLQFDHTAINENHFLHEISSHPDIAFAQFNHLVELRETTPDDPQFGDQWQYINMGNNGGVVDADIDADLAWDITTGGVTAEGDTIVVAILDSGLTPHDDFGTNLWVNHAEIPDNGMDDDNNGYTDDYRGWNIITDSDDIFNGGGHGVAVAGIVGAKGNNGIGVTGVNWDVKLMIIQNNFAAQEELVLEAYTYPLLMRRKYNETDGAEGAFVVATNASWGINNGQPDNAPLWCAFYDTLGHAGILNCGATANAAINVDEDGDLPTACPSDFMISVTNMDRTDNKLGPAGFGLETIDLGAPGEDAFTTAANNSYNGFGGTSGATPHVTGTVALLYSAPCPNLSAIAKVDPAAAALMVKDYILQGVDPNASLAGITVTGGRLNLFNSLEVLEDNCVPCPTATSLSLDSFTDVEAQVSWIPGVYANSSTLRYRVTGSPDWTTIDNATSPTTLSGLMGCTEYEFQIGATCDAGTSDFSESVIFTTDGCCIAPEEVSVSFIGATSAIVTWSNVLAANSYNFILTSPNGQFITTGITGLSQQLMDLEPCEEYTVSIQSMCMDGGTPQSPEVTFTTLGCGACLDFDYCEMEGEDTFFEWIEAVSINTLNNESGNDEGYGDFTGLATTTLVHESDYTIELTPGFAGNAFEEYFKVWIDYNQDGDFEEADELVYDPGDGSNAAVTGMITIPNTAFTGSTRMRVAMRWVGLSQTAEPELCMNPDAGEVEDYCIEISAMSPGCDLPTDLDTLTVGVNSAMITWVDSTDDHVDHNIRYSLASSINWISINNVSAPYELTNLEECKAYVVQVEANCTDGNTSGYTSSLEFTTDCTINVVDPEDSLALQVFPNPFRDFLTITYQQQGRGLVEIDLFSGDGKRVYHWSEERFSGQQTIVLENLNTLPGGVYLLRLATPSASTYRRVIRW